MITNALMQRRRQQEEDGRPGLSRDDGVQPAHDAVVCGPRCGSCWWTLSKFLLLWPESVSFRDTPVRTCLIVDENFILAKPAENVILCAILKNQTELPKALQLVFLNRKCKSFFFVIVTNHSVPFLFPRCRVDRLEPKINCDTWSSRTMMTMISCFTIRVATCFRPRSGPWWRSRGVSSAASRSAKATNLPSESTNGWGSWNGSGGTIVSVHERLEW